jgi:single-stranded DNA-binding protein
MNEVEILGRVANDLGLEKMVTKKGKEVTYCSFLMIDNDFGGNNFNCVCFGVVATNLVKHVVKGQQLLVKGYLKTKELEFNDGKKFYASDVHVRKTYYVGSKKIKERRNEENEENEEQSID